MAELEPEVKLADTGLAQSNWEQGSASGHSYHGGGGGGKWMGLPWWVWLIFALVLLALIILLFVIYWKSYMGGARWKNNQRYYGPDEEVVAAEGAPATVEVSGSNAGGSSSRKAGFGRGFASHNDAWRPPMSSGRAPNSAAGGSTFNLWTPRR